MAKRKTKARKRAVKAKRTVKKAVKARKAGREKRTVRTVKAQTVFRQPLVALQNSFSSLANYFK